jgi:glucokinase
MLRAGVDLGGTKIQVAVIDPDGEVIGQCRVPTPQDNGSQGVLDAIAGAVRDAVADASAELDQLIGVGVGSPGQIDKHAGTVSHAGNLPDWSGSVAVAPKLREELGVPIEIANDVQVAPLFLDDWGVLRNRGRRRCRAARRVVARPGGGR